MAIDAANSIKAENSPEKMLAHQLAVAHKTAMEQFGRASGAYDLQAEMQRLNIALRCMQNVMHATHRSCDAHRTDVRRTFICPKGELHIRPPTSIDVSADGRTIPPSLLLAQNPEWA